MANKELVFPSGVNRRLSLRQEVGRRDRYFSPWAVNVRTEDSLSGRLRGGSWSPSEPATTVGVVHSSGYVVATATNAPGSSSNADCIYRDRFVRPVDQAIFASRQGTYSDWTFSSDLSDMQRPWVIQLSEAGEVGTDVVSVIPHKDAYMLAATSNSLWVVQGDPTADGALRNISREVGMVGARAWCRDHLDRYYFLSSDGLYTVGADGSGLQAISNEVIPEHLNGVTDATTVLEYDLATNGVYIHIPTASYSWMYDTARQAFWPFDTEYAGSHIALGPVQLGNGSSYGRLIQLHGITANGGVNVTWRLLVADTAEQVSANAKTAIEALIAGTTPTNIHSSGVWAAGVNHRCYPRARGKYMILLISAATGDWAWEGAAIVVEPSGQWR